MNHHYIYTIVNILYTGYEEYYNVVFLDIL